MKNEGIMYACNIHSAFAEMCHIRRNTLVCLCYTDCQDLFLEAQSLGTVAWVI
jgi:hypothetical protein